MSQNAKYACFISLCIVLMMEWSPNNMCAAIGGYQTHYSSVPRGELIHHHSLVRPYIHDWWQEGIAHWDIGGDTVVTDEFVRLTPGKPSRFGWIWNNQPNDNPWWEWKAQLHVRSKRNPGADGIAFWYVEDPYKNNDKPGPVLGMVRNFKGIGVIFDSYDNDGMKDNPVVSLIINLHGETTQWDMERDLLHQARARCMFDFRNTNSNDPVEMILTYYENKLSLKLRSEMRGTETFCGEIDGLEIPQGWFFGATATTGHLSDNHDIMSLSLRAVGHSVGDPQIPLQHFDHGIDKQEKTFWAKGDDKK